MKKTRKTLPLLLLSSIALGLIVVSTANLDGKADPILEDQVLTTADGGAAIAFGPHVKKANEVDTAHPVLGVDITESGENKTIRFVAAIDGYQGLSKATWTRSVHEAGATIKEEEVFDLKYVYTVLPQAEDVVWSTPLEADKTYYYMTYTLANIPEANWWSEIDVSLKTYDLTGSLVDSIDDKANVWGVMGDPTIGSVTYEAYPEDSEYYGGYWARVMAGGSEVVIPPFVWELAEGEDHLAENLGPVTTLGDMNDTNGGIENKTITGNVTLPDTIVAINGWGLAGAVIGGTINFPVNLETIKGSAFNGSTSINRIVFETSVLTNVGDYIETTVNEFVVPHSVTALPTGRLFEEDNLIEQITYEGTEAEWAVLAANASETNHIVSARTICSDTEIVVVTFDLQGGTTTIDGAEVSENVLRQVVAGKTVGEPPKVRKPGSYLAGWVLDLGNPEPLDLTTYIVEDDVTLYAYWTGLPAGNSIDDPYVIEGGTYQGAVTTTPDMNVFYLKFTAPANDRYYVILDDAYDGDEEASTASYADPTAFFYDGSKNPIEVGNGFDYHSEHLAVNKKSTYTDTWTVDLNEGDTIYIGITAYYSTYNPDNRYYATVPVDIATAENDTDLEAVELVYGSKQRINFNSVTDASFVLHIPAGTIPSMPAAITLGGEDDVYCDAYIYDEAGTKIENVTATSSEGEVSVILEDLDVSADYYVEITSNFTEGELADYEDGLQSAYAMIGDVPAGMVQSNPLVDPGLSLDMAEPITVSNLNNGKFYYQITVEETTLYRIMLNGGSSYSAKEIEVLDSDGTSIASIVETGEEDDSGWSSDVYYGTLVELDVRLEPGTYILAVGYVSTSATYPFTIQLAEGVAGFGPGFAIETEVSGNALTLTPVEGLDTTYFSFVAPTTIDADLVSDNADAELVLLDADGQEIVSNIGSVNAALMEGETYILGVSGVGTDPIVISINEHVGPFSPYPWAIGTYNGTQHGTSYYKLKITGDDVAWENNDGTQPSIIDYDETKGAISFSFVGNPYYEDTYEAVIDDNGNALINVYESDGQFKDIYYLSLHQSQYSTSIIAGQYAATEDYDGRLGIALISVAVDTPEEGRVYGAVIEGEAYPTVDVTFVSGASLDEVGAVAEVRADGVLLGTATIGEDSVLTWAPAAAI